MPSKKPPADAETISSMAEQETSMAEQTEGDDDDKTLDTAGDDDKTQATNDDDDDAESKETGAEKEETEPEPMEE